MDKGDSPPRTRDHSLGFSSSYHLAPRMAPSVPVWVPNMSVNPVDRDTQILCHQAMIASLCELSISLLIEPFPKPMPSHIGWPEGTPQWVA